MSICSTNINKPKHNICINSRNIDDITHQMYTLFWGVPNVCDYELLILWTTYKWEKLTVYHGQSVSLQNNASYQ